MRSLHRAYEAAPHAYRRAGEGSSLFLAWHMRKRPPLCTRRAPLTWGGARLAGENASIRECPCLRRIACSGAIVRPACGSAPTPMCRGIAGQTLSSGSHTAPPASLTGCFMGSLCAQCIRSACGYPLYMRLRKAVCKGTILPSLQGIFCCCLCRQVPHFLLREHHYPL